MKNTVFITLASAFILMSCGEKKVTEDLSAKPADSTEVVNTTTENEGVVDQQIQVMGVVEEIQQGKDGITAKIKSEEGKHYFATISIPNLKDPAQYREVKVGDKITVTGESWEMDGNTHIKVTALDK